MKKLTKIWSLVLAMLLLTACCGTPVVIAPPADKAPEEEVVQPQPEAGTAVKTGLAVVPGVGSSKDATAEENGVAQSDITLVAVTVDDNGVITDCAIDGIQAKIAFGADGALATDLATTFPTKNELGQDYGMGKFSPIGKEWSEQVEALAQYAIGKTIDELKGISLNEKGAATDADLAAACTISIGGTVDAIVQAVENAQHLGAAQGDKLAIGASTNMSKSKDVADGKDGVAQAYATVAAVTFRNGVISSCAIDAVQANVNFDAAGKITTDLSAPVLTKNQLGDDYGMKKASAIGKEWYEQAAAFAQYATGKTLNEINGIALNEKGGAADADLAASVTVSLGGFQEIIAKAAA